MGINVNIYNIILFNIGWFACVLGGNAWASFAVVAITWMHVNWVSGSWKDWPQLVTVTIIGVVVDTLLIVSGLLQMHTSENAGLLLPYFPPFWMICLWWLFATTLRHSLRWFYDKPVLAFFCGLIAGPLTYRAGAAFNDIEFGFPLLLSFLVLGVCWAFLFPALLFLSNRSVGYHAVSKSA